MTNTAPRGDQNAVSHGHQHTGHIFSADDQRCRSEAVHVSQIKMSGCSLGQCWSVITSFTPVRRSQTNHPNGVLFSLRHILPSVFPTRNRETTTVVHQQPQPAPSLAPLLRGRATAVPAAAVVTVAAGEAGAAVVARRPQNLQQQRVRRHRLRKRSRMLTVVPPRRRPRCPHPP